MPSPLVKLRSTGLSIERAVKQQRWLWRYSHCKRVLQHWMKNAATEPDQVKRRCLLDLRRIEVDGEQGRRFHALVMLLHRGGYELSMVPRLQFLQTGHRTFKASALSRIKPFFEDELPANFRPFHLCLSDSGRAHRLALRTIDVKTSTQRALGKGDLALPYSFFPTVWDQREDDRLGDYRRRDRVWRLFFGGHRSRESYSRIEKYTRLRPVDRYRVVKEVNRYFAKSTLVITSNEQLESAVGQRHESFVLIDNAVYRPPPNRWLGLLAQSDFFLAAPGCDYPLSHNAIESVAVGTIPVLEYDSLFSPPLHDGENCIAYRGLDGLREAIGRIDSMSQTQIERLRSEVIEYYESHLSPHAFREKLEDERTRCLHLFAYLTPEAKKAA